MVEVYDSELEPDLGLADSKDKQKTVYVSNINSCSLPQSPKDVKLQLSKASKIFDYNQQQ